MAEIRPTDVQKALKGASYPADRESLTDLARKNKADKKVVEEISHLKRDRYEGPNEVQKELYGS